MKSDERNLPYDRPGRPPNIGWDWLRKAVIKASEEVAQERENKCSNETRGEQDLQHDSEELMSQ